jgi:hypothetical protein
MLHRGGEHAELAQAGRDACPDHPGPGGAGEDAEAGAGKIDRSNGSGHTLHREPHGVTLLLGDPAEEFEREVHPGRRHPPHAGTRRGSAQPRLYGLERGTDVARELERHEASHAAQW